MKVDARAAKVPSVLGVVVRIDQRHVQEVASRDLDERSSKFSVNDDPGSRRASVWGYDLASAFREVVSFLEGICTGGTQQRMPALPQLRRTRAGPLKTECLHYPSYGGRGPVALSDPRPP